MVSIFAKPLRNTSCKVPACRCLRAAVCLSWETETVTCVAWLQQSNNASTMTYLLGQQWVICHTRITSNACKAHSLVEFHLVCLGNNIWHVIYVLLLLCKYSYWKIIYCYACKLVCHVFIKILYYTTWISKCLGALGV